MKKLLSSVMNLRVVGIILITVLSFACSDDDDGGGGGGGGPMLTGNSEEYELLSVSDPAVSGMVTFEERDDGVTVVTIELNGTAGGDHPSHIHANTAVEGGGILIDLTNVDGGSGTSVTEVNMMNDGTPITYNELINFDGHVNVHLSGDDLATLIAQGDIGQNALTGTSVEYPLGPVSDPNVSGTATFSERNSGETLVEMVLEGTSAGGDHPSHIHANTAAEGGGILIDLTNVDGETGISATNISMMNDGTPITYSELIEFNGYINVHISPDDLATLIAQGDIGGNALTGESVEYVISSVAPSDVSGTATFAQRNNLNTLVTLELTGTLVGDHPAHIHENDAATGGGILIDLTNVDATGFSATSISVMNDGTTAITYDELIAFNGHINVHLSSAQLDVLIAQGDIGSNAN